MVVVRDLGASLGRTMYLRLLKWFRLRGFGQGTRNDLPGFEEQGFILAVDDRSRIAFDYRGIYRDVINTVTPGERSLGVPTPLAPIRAPVA